MMQSKLFPLSAQSSYVFAIELHPEPEEVTGLSTPLMPKRENFFLMFTEPHFGHDTGGLDDDTSFSKFSEQSVHAYS